MDSIGPTGEKLSVGNHLVVGIKTDALQRCCWNIWIDKLTLILHVYFTLK